MQLQDAVTVRALLAKQVRYRVKRKHFDFVAVKGWPDGQVRVYVRGRQQLLRPLPPRGFYWLLSPKSEHEGTSQFTLLER
jgi:hypothetical protein